MRSNQHSVYYTLKLICFSLVIASLTCQPANNPFKDLQQTRNDLLDGVTTAVAYSGFRQGQHPDRGNGAVNPTDEEILEDLQILARNQNFALIRLYDAQENSKAVLRIIKDNNINIKAMLGIWLDAEISNHKGCPWLNEPISDEILKKNKDKNRKEIDRGIHLANAYKDIIVAVNVGNEALVGWSDHLVNVDTVISYVKRVKNSVSQNVTVAENYDWWTENGKMLAKELDFISIHTYPLWEGKDIDEGLSYTIENIRSVRNALPKSRLVISEAGWATIASEFGDRASEEKQLQYFNQLFEWALDMNITTFWFAASMKSGRVIRIILRVPKNIGDYLQSIEKQSWLCMNAIPI